MTAGAGPTGQQTQLAAGQAMQQKMLAATDQMTRNASYLLAIANLNTQRGYGHGQFGSLVCDSAQSLRLCARLLNVARWTVRGIVMDLVVPALRKAGQAASVESVLAQIEELARRDTGTPTFEGLRPVALSQADMDAMAEKDRLIAEKRNKPRITTS